MLAQKRATTSRPSYSKGIGGIEMKTSSVRRATSASRSADSYALTNFATIAFSAGESDGGGGLRSAVAGLRHCRLVRARLRAHAVVRVGRRVAQIVGARGNIAVSVGSIRGIATNRACATARTSGSICKPLSTLYGKGVLGL